MTPVEVPRPDLARALLERTRTGPPLLLTGPPGAGKTTLLRRLGEALAAEGWAPVYLDLMGAVSSPDRFVTAALDALPAALFGHHLPRAAELRRLAASGRAHEAEAVRGLLDLWSQLDQAGDRPVALLLDEATEIRSLAYFSELREAARLLGTALLARRRGTLLATSFPTLARGLWAFDSLPARPLAAEDLAPSLAAANLRADAAALIRASAGWPRYLRILLAGLTAGEDLPAVWAREMALGGRLETACRATYESLLLRSRGYGISKALLGVVAGQEGANLKALVARLGRTPGATRDYLQWLLGVDALRVERKRYFYVDGVLRRWVVLHTRGNPPDESELRAAALEAAGLVAGEPDRETSLPVRRRESLMEID